MDRFLHLFVVYVYGLLRRLVFFAYGRRLHEPLARCPGVPEVPEDISVSVIHLALLFVVGLLGSR